MEKQIHIWPLVYPLDEMIKIESRFLYSNSSMFYHGFINPFFIIPSVMFRETKLQIELAKY